MLLSRAECMSESCSTEYHLHKVAESYGKSYSRDQGKNMLFFALLKPNFIGLTIQVIAASLAAAWLLFWTNSKWWAQNVKHPFYGIKFAEIAQSCSAVRLISEAMWKQRRTWNFLCRERAEIKHSRSTDKQSTI